MSARQPLLGTVAPDRKRMTPFQKEMERRAEGILPPGQQASAYKRAKRADRAQRERAEKQGRSS